MIHESKVEWKPDPASEFLTDQLKNSCGMLGSVPFLCNFRVEVQVLGPGGVRTFFPRPAKIHGVNYPKTLMALKHILNIQTCRFFMVCLQPILAKTAQWSRCLSAGAELESPTRLAHILKKEWTSNCRERWKRLSNLSLWFWPSWSIKLLPMCNTTAISIRKDYWFEQLADVVVVSTQSVATAYIH